MPDFDPKIPPRVYASTNANSPRHRAPEHTNLNPPPRESNMDGYAKLREVLRERYGAARIPAPQGLPCGHTAAEHTETAHRLAAHVLDLIAREVPLVDDRAAWRSDTVSAVEGWHRVHYALAATLVAMLLEGTTMTGGDAFMAFLQQGHPIAGALVAYSMGTAVEYNGNSGDINGLTGLCNVDDALALIAFGAVTAAKLGMTAEDVRALHPMWRGDDGHCG